ncbi:MAG: cell envelope biogenesis protein TolA [Sphingobium sp.]
MERSDKIGLSVAGAGHVLLLAVLSFGLFKAPKAPILKQDTMDVSLVDAVALTAATRSPAPPATSQAPEAGPAEDAAPAPAPAPEPEPIAKPEPTPPPPPPRPQPKPEPKPAPEPRPVPKPTPKPKPVAEKPQPQKTPPPKPKPAAAPPEAKKTPPAKPVAKPATTPSKSTTPAKTAAPSKSTAPAKSPAPATAKADAKSTASGSGKAERPRGSRLGANFLQGIADDTPAPPAKSASGPLSDAEARALNQAISRQLKPRWKAPTGADVDQLVTVLTWRLNKDGSIASGPTVVEQTGKTDGNRPQQQLHIEAAIRAVRAAAPFDLPEKYYDNWKFIEAFRFDKRL